MSEHACHTHLLRRLHPHSLHDPHPPDHLLALGAINACRRLAIAVFKATLVVLFFMHVKYSSRLTWAVVLGGVFWLGILLVLTMSDYLTRSWLTFG